MDTTDDVAMPFLLMAAFRNLVDAVHRHLEANGHPGIRAAHGFAMQAIGAGCTSVELGHRLGVTKQAATKTAQTLEAMGLIERQENPHDRRERMLVPTSRGHQMLRLSADAFRAELQCWRARSGDGNVDSTLATLAAAAVGGRSQLDLSDWT